MENTKRLENIINVIKNQNLIKNFTPENLKTTLELLGPTYIKFGQIVASHEDLIPLSYCEKLKELRNNVYPMERTEVIEILNEECANHQKLFSNISNIPIGSASIAEVYTATLFNGNKIILKIQRKGIDKQMLEDINLFEKVVSFFHLDTFLKKYININELIKEYKEITINELNFLKEADNIERFTYNQRTISYIKVPKVYKELSTKKLLVMEYLEGIPLSNIESLINKNYNLPEIANYLALNYMKQALDDGFYHSDPHQENIKITENKIIYLDFGLMGYLSQDDKQFLKKCIKKIVFNDTYGLTELLTTLSNDLVNKRELNLKLKNLFNKYLNQSLESIRFQTFFKEFLDILKNNNILLPTNIVNLGRGIVILEGVLKELDPKINLFRVLKNYLKLNKDTLFTKEELNKKILTTLNDASDLTKVPNELLTFLRAVNNGEAKFNIEFNNSNKQIDKFEVMLHEFIICLLDVALIIGASLMDKTNHPILRNIYIVGIIILSIWLIIRMYIDHKTRGMK